MALSKHIPEIEGQSYTLYREKSVHTLARKHANLNLSAWSLLLLLPMQIKMKNQRSLRDSTILHGVCVGEMLVLKAICDALTHWLTVQKAFISVHPPPPPPQKKFLALLRHLTQTCEWKKYTICVQIIPFWSKLLLQLDMLKDQLMI